MTRNNFTVYDDQIAQQITYFSNTDSPASVGFVFDISSSMRGEKIAHAREAMNRFIQTSHAQDEYSLICFNQTPEIRVEGARDGEILLSKLNRVQPRGQTALYDAVSLGLRQISRAMHPKRALIVLSDGEDNNSRLSFDQLRQQIKESDALIYTILIGPLKPLSNGGVILEMMADVNGGKSFFPSKIEKLDEVFEQIALELRQQYSLAYEPSNFIADGKWHRLKVKVTPPSGVGRIVIRTREGYFARVRDLGGVGE